MSIITHPVATRMNVIVRTSSRDVSQLCRHVHVPISSAQALSEHMAGRVTHDGRRSAL